MNKQEIEKAIELLRIINHNAKVVHMVKDMSDVTTNEEKTQYREDFRLINIAISALIRQLNNGWISCKEQLPPNEERVFICSDRKFYVGEITQIRTIAMYEDGTMHTDDSGYSWEDNDFEYDEETDDYIIPEGWYEQNMYSEEFGIVDDFVTHWMSLPDCPTVN